MNSKQVPSGTSTSAIPSPPKTSSAFTDHALALITDLQTKVADWQHRQMAVGRPPRATARSRPQSQAQGAESPSPPTPHQVPNSTLPPPLKAGPTKEGAVRANSEGPRPASVPENLPAGNPATRSYARRQVAVLIRPPPPVKLTPCYPTGYVKEMEPVEETERLRQQYNRRPPWDKTPAWRPMTREEASDVYARNERRGDDDASQSSLSPLQLRVVKLSHALSPSSNRSSLSAGLSDTDRSMQSPEASWEALETLERTNASLLRPVGRSLLATHRLGELNLPSSPLRIAEYNKQIRGPHRPPVAECTLQQVTKYPPIMISPRAQEELDRAEWEAQRRTQRRIVAVASKAIADETNAVDAGGIPLSLFSAHRRHHEMQ